MNSPQLGLRVASILAGGFTIGHLCRLLTATHVQIGMLEISPWISLLAVAAGGALCVWFWRLSLIVEPAPQSPPSPAVR